MKCTRVGNRIEIAPSLNPFEVKSNNQFIQTLDDPKYHGFDTPARKVWTVLDTPTVRQQLRVRGYRISEGSRECIDMFATLEKMCKLVDSYLTSAKSVVYL